ncbi:serine hydrolase domain-containing protein [Plebeiibacterium sediminum]|uniref:Beta-lactamase family protein n=1 Tax=Plebeiibacterium sediminum TaxID=2992112 RepID=A0AAE3M7G4_9BACT|nr:serine hydrolase domain-containing protein [Plebeiobacterium sediminum]MCW3788513.1 beta-lactamase family protein [Plebeiobacterium sediminum]
MKLKICIFLILLSIFLSNKVAYSLNTNPIKTDLCAWIDSSFTKAMNEYHIPGATIIVMKGDSVLHMNGYGMAHIETNTSVVADSTIFGIASISKTFVGTAIMQLYEKGKLDLDRDVNNYLTSFKLKYKFNDSITVRNLLTHTAGLDYSIIGMSVRSKKDLIPLDKYLKTKLPPQIRPSGKVMMYSNQGYALLGFIVEEVSGIPYYEYVSQNILNPLEMNSSSYRRASKLNENYATGYVHNGERFIPFKPDFLLCYPAGGLFATASDMGNYISMFLNNGSFKGRQILDSTSVAKMLYSPFKQYEKAEYGWLLGLYEFQSHKIKYYGHDGSWQGFQSRLALFPDKNIGFFIDVNSEGSKGNSQRFINEFADSFVERMMPQSIIEKQQAEVTPKRGSVDEPLNKFAGKYRLTAYAHKTLGKLGVLIGLVPEITIVSQDSILKVLDWNLELLPVSDLTFHTKYGHFAFDRDTRGEIFYFFTQIYSYQKLKWYEPVTFQMYWIGSIILIVLIYIITSVERKLFSRHKKSNLIKKMNFALALTIALFIGLLAYTLTKTELNDFFFGIPLLLKITLVIPFIIIPLECAAIYSLIKAIRFKELKPVDIAYQSLMLVAALLFIPWLQYYNLIGFNY